MQSRYYDPELGRFINADAFASTGQGILGNNMFAYCQNNPINISDHSGAWPTLSDVLTSVAIAAVAVMAVSAVVAMVAMSLPAVITVGGAAISTTAITTAAMTLGFQAGCVATGSAIVAQASKSVEKKYSRKYTVYFLEDENGVVQYVGRVTDSGYNARMAYHLATRGLTPQRYISGLSYDVARGLEEIAMIECHTLNPSNPKNNQIHGIGINNPRGEQYLNAAADYLLNKAEDTLLNMLLWGE